MRRYLTRSIRHQAACIGLGLALSLSSLAPAQASEWGPWEDARALYDAGNYAGALEALKSRPVFDSPSYFYNLGSVYFRMGELGSAMAYLEKAKRMNPQDPDIGHNLELVRQALTAKAGISRLDPASNWAEAAADHLPLEPVGGTVALILFLALVLSIRNYRKTRSSNTAGTPRAALVHALTRRSGLVSLFALLAMGGLVAVESLGESAPPAVLLTSQVVRSGPGERFLDLATLQAGVKVRLTGRVTQESNAPEGNGQAELWRQVRYGADAVGWIKGSSLLLL